uniref:Copia protein n=1 Tax=Cajanus cajan TaxID=3821 RepID=A0A151RSN5_CAJCA|nr:hypothetical protein KK1_032901 [Cajanus cajan]
MTHPTTTHSQAAFHILRYRKGSPGSSIFFPTDSIIQLMAFSDFDWACCIDSCLSITGSSIYLGHSLISWRSKKQSTVFKNSSEAEYRVLASITCELQWLTYFLQDLRVPFLQPVVLYCDNQSAI